MVRSYGSGVLSGAYGGPVVTLRIVDAKGREVAAAATIQNERVTIGRSSQCKIYIHTDIDAVSREHATMTRLLLSRYSVTINQLTDHSWIKRELRRLFFIRIESIVSILELEMIARL